MRRLARTGAALLAIASLGVAACSSDGGDGASSGPAGTDGAPSTQPGGSSPTGEQPRSGGSFTALHYSTAPLSWDPDLSVSAATSRVGTANYFSAVYGFLLYEDWQTGEVVPKMAESLQPTDAANWVLKLRPNVRFTDGTAYDAAAVKFNWERIAADPKSGQASVAKTIKAMTVVDPLTLDVELVAPNSTFDRTVAANLPWIASPTALQADAAAFLNKPVGAGPFTLESYGADFTATLKRNPGYWDQPRPYLDTLVIKTVLDPTQRYNAFAAGDGDVMTELAGPTLQTAKSAGDEPMRIVAPGGGRMVLFNTKTAPFDDVIARRAFQYAFDSDAYNETVFAGSAIGPLKTIFDEKSPFYAPDAPLIQHDEAKAQQLFDEYAAKHGGPMKITYLGATSAVTSGTIDLLSATLRDYDNVEFTAESVDANDYSSKAAAGGHSIVQYSWEAADPGQTFKDLYSTTGSRNFLKYSNPRVDELLARADAETDRDARVELLDQVQEILVNDDAIPALTLRIPNDVILSDRARGFDHYANTGIWLWDQVWVTR